MQNETPITTTYKGVVLTYNETTRYGISVSWSFELRGRQRSALTLEAAREAIDKAPAKDKKPFTRFTAFRHGTSRYGNDKYGTMTEVEVTSIASVSSYGDGAVEVWVIDKNDKKSRGRYSLTALSADSVANRLIMDRVRELNAEIDAAETSRDKLIKKLKAPVIPKDQIEEVS